MSSLHSMSFENEKTRWLHVEGNPAPAWKLNAYFAEALTVYSLPWEGIFGDGTDATWILASMWWVLRAFYFFLRRRGIGQLFTLGNPNVAGSTDDRFAVPIRMLDATTDAFLHLKGISILDPSDSATKTFPGLGFLPVCCGCYAEHSITIGERHFKMCRASNSHRSFSRGCSRTDYFCGLIEDASWVGVSKQGKACSRLLVLIYQAFVSVFWLTLLIATQTYGSTCRPTLSMTAADWQTLGSVGRLEWCDQFKGHDVDTKPGKPCVCWRSGIGGWPQASADAELCNPMLDPRVHTSPAGDDSWCHQWSMADGVDWAWIIQSDRPCECLWWFQRFQWRLLGLIDAIVLGSVTLGILYVWILVTPIWFELGIFGVDNRIREHIAAVRISSHNRGKLPLIFLQRKLGRAILTDSSTPTPAGAAKLGNGEDASDEAALAAPGGDILCQWKWKPLLYRCTNGVREELTLHRDLLHLHTRSGTPVCLCSCHGLNEWCLKLPIDVDDYYVLLRDITFIEVITVRSSAMVQLLCYVVLLATIVCLVAVGLLVGSCPENAEGERNLSGGGNSVAVEEVEDQFCLELSGQGGFTVVVVTVALMLWLLGWMLTGKLRHPYIHIGVLPGGGRRGRANPLGGNSPFYMRLPGTYADRLEEIVSVIRATQLESLQHDLAASLHETDAHALGRRRLRTAFSGQTTSSDTTATATNVATVAASGVSRGVAPVRRLQQDKAMQSAAEQDAAQMAAEMAMIRFGVKGALGIDVDTIEAQTEGVDTNLTADEVVRGELEAKVCAGHSAQILFCSSNVSLFRPFDGGLCVSDYQQLWHVISICSLDDYGHQPDSRLRSR